MSDPRVVSSAVDAAHFFSRVMQVGVAIDIAQCRSALNARYLRAVRNISLPVVADDSIGLVLSREAAPESTPQLEHVAELLLKVGSDLPLLRLSALLEASTETGVQSEVPLDPWFVERSVRDDYTLSYARYFYNDDLSEGHLDVLTRTFQSFPSQVVRILTENMLVRVSDISDDWGRVEGSIGGTTQIDLEIQWDGFTSIDIQAATDRDFEEAATQVMRTLAGVATRPVEDIGLALIDAVDREKRFESS